MLQFKFRHITPDLLAQGKCQGERCGTSCTIINEDNTILGEGDSFLHEGDNFSRPLGRKISAGRAIRHGIDRFGRRDKVGAEKRRAAWEQLFLKSPDTFRGGR